MLEIIPLGEPHLEDCARLVSGRFQRLRQQVPVLPQQYEESSNLWPLLQNILTSGPGVAAMENGRLVGFLAGWLMPDFRGKRSVYSPEWGNGAPLEGGRLIYEEMYKRLAAVWMGENYTTHYISLLANDQTAVEAWHWMGFGMLSIDAIRGMQAIQGVKSQVDIQRASVQDMDQILKLSGGLRRYMMESPVFFIPYAWEESYYREWIDDPGKVIWLARVNGEAVAFLRMGPANRDVSAIIVDENTTSIYGAYTEEGMRGNDIATALLNHGLTAARDMGYERCAVDFETMNLLGTRFWLGRGFKPVCYSLVRYVDERFVQ